jgi:hypothetical protein
MHPDMASQQWLARQSQDQLLEANQECNWRRKYMLFQNKHTIHQAGQNRMLYVDWINCNSRERLLIHVKARPLLNYKRSRLLHEEVPERAYASISHRLDTKKISPLKPAVESTD